MSLLEKCLVSTLIFADILFVFKKYLNKCINMGLLEKCLVATLIFERILFVFEKSLNKCKVFFC